MPSSIETTDWDPSRLCKKICINGYKQLNIYLVITLLTLNQSTPLTSGEGLEVLIIFINRNRTISMHNTYSLKAILESDLDPALCKLMLHEIKSPLLEHSFQLTTDDEYNGGSFSIPNHSQHSKIKRDREKELELNFRNQELEKQREFQRMHQRLNQMSMAMSQNQTSRREMNHSPNKTYSEYSPRNQSRNRKANESHYADLAGGATSYVSPLQYNNKVGVPNAKTSGNDIFFLQSASQCQSFEKQSEKGQDGVAQWCGEVFNMDNAYQNELVADYMPMRPYKRKKIFTQKVQYTIQKVSKPAGPTFSGVSFSEAINRLKQINEPQLSNFLSLLARVLEILSKVEPYRTRLQKNESLLNKMLLTENPIDHEVRETISNKKRIINRLKVNKMSEALPRLLGQSDRNPSWPSEVENDLCKTLQHYSEIEDIIEDYVSRKEIVNELNLVYNFLFQSEISLYKIETDGNNRISTQNESSKENQKFQTALRPSNDNLKNKLHKVLSCLQINPSQFENLNDLSYIWSEINDGEGYAPHDSQSYKKNREKFMNELCRNDLLIHEAIRGISELNIERKLSQMGFRRNQS